MAATITVARRLMHRPLRPKENQYYRPAQGGFRVASRGGDCLQVGPAAASCTRSDHDEFQINIDRKFIVI